MSIASRCSHLDARPRHRAGREVAGGVERSALPAQSQPRRWLCQRSNSARCPPLCVASLLWCVCRCGCSHRGCVRVRLRSPRPASPASVTHTWWAGLGWLSSATDGRVNDQQPKERRHADRCRSGGTVVETTVDTKRGDATSSIAQSTKEGNRAARVALTRGAGGAATTFALFFVRRLLHPPSKTDASATEASPVAALVPDRCGVLVYVAVWSLFISSIDPPFDSSCGTERRLWAFLSAHCDGPTEHRDADEWAG